MEFVEKRSNGASRSTLLILLFLSGCGAPPRFIAHGFDEFPPSLHALERDGELQLPLLLGSSGRARSPEGNAMIRNGRLILSGSQVLLEEFPFQQFRGICEFVVQGGILEESAGIFVEETVPLSDGTARRSYFILALNGRGERRAYRGWPGQPLGVAKWIPLSDPNPTLPRRLGVECDGKTLRFLLDGVEVASSILRSGKDDLPRGSKSPAPLSPSEAGKAELRVGLFATNLAASFDNFIFGEDGPQGPFRPETHVKGGGAQHGEDLLAEAEERTEEFRRRPTRAGLFSAMEAFTRAELAFRLDGEVERAGEASAAAAKAFARVRPQVKAARSEDLLRLFAGGFPFTEEDRDALAGSKSGTFSKRAREAEAAGRPAEALISWLAAAETEGAPEAAGAAEKLLPLVRRPLSFHPTVREATKPSPEFSRKEFFGPIREIYGALPEAEDAEIQLEIDIEEAKVAEEVEDAQRKVGLSVSEKPMPPQLRAELARLEKSFPEDKRDAVAKAKVQRVVDLSRFAKFTVVAFDGPSVEVLVEDGKKLEKSYARLRELRALREAEEASMKEFVSIPAKLHTDSLRVKASITLAWAGKVVHSDSIEFYDGMEQWSHPASRDRKVQASAYSKAERDRMVQAGRDRVLSRLRTGIARERIVGKLSEDDATLFILRFARSGGEEGDRAVAAWRIRSVYGIEEEFTLQKVLGTILSKTGGRN